MGGNESKLAVCHYCATEITPPPPLKSAKKGKDIHTKKDLQTDFYSSGDEKQAASTSSSSLDKSHINLDVPCNTLSCSRCHGFYKLPSPNSSSTDLKNQKSSKDKSKTHRRYIEYCRVAPFGDTLLYSDEKEMDQEYIINTYLKPYFETNHNIVIRAPYRFNIKNVEFKVLACYPPKGYISEDTKFYLNDNKGKLIKLKFETIKQIHLLPIKSSLNTYKKLNGIPIDDDKKDKKEEKKNNNDNNNNNNNGGTVTRDYSNKDLLKLSLKPYLKGNDKLLYISHPENKKENEDKVDEDGRFYLSDKTLFGDDTDEEKKENDQQENKDENTNDNEEKREDKRKRRHLIEEETFISHGICWRVMKCIPSNGYIDSSTEIFCHGKPIQDSKKIVIRPIYETIPYAHRNFTPRQFKIHYLNPFFLGSSRYIDHSRQVKIFGVDFSIRECKPGAGVITMKTKIDYMGTAIKQQELENMQAMEDMEMAQKIHKQMEEENARRIRDMPGRGRGGGGGGGGRRPGLSDLGWEDPLGFDFPEFQFPWTQPQQPPKPPKRGVDPNIIERLPTFEFKQNNKDSQCRICLEYYVEGDELRILPCFHLYHKACVDTWLTRMSSKCPICKTSIIRKQQRRNQ